MWKKGTALALAAAIVCAAPIMPVFAASSNETQAATLAFIKQSWDSDKVTDRTTMVSGSSVKVDISIKAGYEVDQKGNQFTYDTGTGVPPTNDDIKFVGGGGDGEHAVQVAPTYPGTDKIQTLQIKGNYYTTTGMGRASETINGATQTEIDVKVADAQIMEFGRIVLRCVEGEGVSGGKSTGGARFEIDEVTDGLTIFDKTKTTVAVSRLQKTNELELQLKVPLTTGGDYMKTFTLTPTKGYSYFRDPKTAAFVDSDGNPFNPPIEPGKVPPTKVNNDVIQIGEKIELILRKPISNVLSLTIYSPDSAVEEISRTVRSDAGKMYPSEFIKLTGSDEMSWITQDFQLRQSHNEFNTNFKINWKWEPDVASDEGVVTVSKSNGEWTDVRVNRTNKEDVKGKLTYSVSYKDLYSTETKSVPVEIPIVVKGTGTPPSVKMTGKWLHTLDGPCDDEDAKDYSPITPENPDNKQYNMDVYKGGIPGYANSTVPYRHEMRIDLGAVQSYAQYMIVDLVSGSKDAVSLQMISPDGKLEAYVPGSGAKYKNPSTITDTSTSVRVLVNAIQKGNAVLKFRFFVGDARGKPVELTGYQPVVTFNVDDRSPSDNSKLQSLVMKNQKGAKIEFGFQPDKVDYNTIADTIHLPHSTEYFTLEPLKMDPAAKKEILVETFDINETPKSIIEQTGKPDDSSADVESGKSVQIKPEVTNEVYKVKLTVTAQNPNIKTVYTLHVVWDPASTDKNLKSLGLYLESDATAMKNNLIKGFDPLSDGPYKFSVPYGTRFLKAAAETSSPFARELAYKPELVNRSLLGTKEWLDLTEMKAEEGGDGHLLFTASVLPEDTTIADARNYLVHIYREPPCEISSLKELKIADADEKAITYTPSFKPAVTGPYRVKIPYSTKEVKLQVTPTDSRFYDIYAVDQKKPDVKYDLTKRGVYSQAIPVEAISVDNPYTTLEIHVRAESYNPKQSEAENAKNETVYEVQVERAEPSDDATLKSLILFDQDKAQIKNFAYNANETSYTLKVPFETSAVAFQPTSNQEGARIRIWEEGNLIQEIVPYYVPSGTVSKNFKLAEPEVPKEFRVIGTAENGVTEKTYTITITRGPPSSDARLKALTAQNTEDFKPLFIASTENYSATVTTGAPGTIITATANHPGATIKINGNAAQSGAPSDLIELIEIKQKVLIEVTAQDGVTKKTYSITFTNDNLIEKTSNADLRKLTVNYGQMTPSFKAAVTEYAVAATEDTYSVDVIPRPADSLATMQVFSGSKEIGDYNGNYAQYIEDGDNEISIKVTSPDETVTKTYTVTIYRNEEDELRNLKPLESDDIDYENSGDVIIVMIDEYPRVSADVFNELKNYPEKTIIFQGNDYSLELKASDIDRVIPQTEIYDFRMSFDSPDEDDINDRIESRSRNDDLDDVVMMYFSHHGSLPGPTILHVSLGRKYNDETLYWHYYNQERDRIDYYGALETNSKGTFAVNIDHFSTYLISRPFRIAGSEDKEGNVDEIGVSRTSEELLNSVVKVNPNTGVSEGRP